MTDSGRDKVGILMYGDAWPVRVADGILDQRVDAVIAIVQSEENTPTQKHIHMNALGYWEEDLWDPPELGGEG